MTPRTAPPATADLRDTARLLHSVFPIARFADERYLEWFYRGNPIGLAIEVDRDGPGGRIGHLAGIPQEYHSAGRLLPGVFPLNIAVAPEGRGRGLMTEMSEACFAEGVRRYGDGVLVGMPNDASTPGYTGRLGFRLVRPMPVVVCPPVWPGLGRSRSFQVTPERLQSTWLDALVDTIDLAPASGWSHRWTLPVLRWRLGAPGATYWVHEDREAVIVTTAVAHRGVPVAVVLKTFRRRGVAGRARTNALVAAACRRHRAVGAVYAGFSATTRTLGTPLPARLKPAPLNLIVRSLRPGFLDPYGFEFDTFELFEFDAY